MNKFYIALKKDNDSYLLPIQSIPKNMSRELCEKTLSIVLDKALQCFNYEVFKAFNYTRFAGTGKSAKITLIQGFENLNCPLKQLKPVIITCSESLLTHGFKVGKIRKVKTKTLESINQVEKINKASYQF